MVRLPPRYSTRRSGVGVLMKLTRDHKEAQLPEVCPPKCHVINPDFSWRNGQKIGISENNNIIYL